MKFKNKLFVLALAFISTMFCACSADYDTFGESGYRALNDIRFEEQDGNSSFYLNEHKIKITLLEPTSKDSTWDSVTVESFNISNMSSMHLVDGKFKVFPTDSISLDSLAQKVSYKSTKIRPGDKIRIPESLLFYVLVIAENGDASIWQLEFTIPGVAPASSDSKDENSDKISSSEKSESQKTSSSSMGGDSQKDDKNDLQVVFKNEISNKISNDTIYVTFAQGVDLSKVTVDTVIYHRKSSIDVNPMKVTDWNNVHIFKVSAENGNTKKWVVVVQALKSSDTDLQISFEKQLKVNRNGDTIAVKLENECSIDDAKLSSFSISSGATIKPLPSDLKKWGDSQTFTVIAEDGTEKTWVLTIAIAAFDEQASDEKELISISAKDEIAQASIDKLEKNVILHLSSKDALTSAIVTIKVSETASHNLGSNTLNLVNPKIVTITAEDGSTVEWKISADYPKSSDTEILSFEVDDIVVSNLKIDSKDCIVSFSVPFSTDLSKVYFQLKLSEGAQITSPNSGEIDLSSKKGTIVIKAEDGSLCEWNINVEELPLAQEPRILGMKINGQSAVVDSIEENGSYVYWVHYDNLTFLADLTRLVVSDIQLTEGSSITGVVDGSSYDLSYGIKVTVRNLDGKTLDYEIRAGYQYPNSDMENWNSSDKKPSDWDNGNQTSVLIKAYMTESVETSLSGTAAKMKSMTIAGLSFASGNVFIGTFNPKKVKQISMIGYKDGNELIDFGKPFIARPRYLEVDFKYDGKNSDSCDIYIILENRSRTSDNGSNLKRTSSDVNTLVASAWYRAKTDSSFSNPDVVSISKRNADGLRTLRLALKYGEPYKDSPIMNIGSGVGKVSVLSEEGLKNKDGIDNHVVVGDGSDPITHIRIIAASSADGNHYEGTEDATLIVDNFRLVY